MLALLHLSEDKPPPGGAVMGPTSRTARCPLQTRRPSHAAWRSACSILFGLLLVCLPLYLPSAVAQQCAATGAGPVNCNGRFTSSGTGSLLASQVTPAIGSGPGITTLPINSGPFTAGSPGTNGTTLNVGTISPTTASGTNITALGVGDNNTITIGSGTTISTTTNNGNNSNGSVYQGTGPNTIELGRNNTLTIDRGATVQAVAGGTTPNQNSEAINAMGFGNTIVNFGTISSSTSSAIFLQNNANPAIYSSGVSAGNTTLRDTVNGVSGVFGTLIYNYGTITSTATLAGARNLQAVSETPNTAQNVYFANEPGAVVNGNVNMGNGNDTVELFSGSTINGNPGPNNNLFALSAGTGTDTLILNGVSGQPTGKLAGSLQGFDFLTKVGDGPWEITGALNTSGTNAAGKTKSLTAVVQAGTLVLSGNTPGPFNGTMTVDAPGTLQIGNGGTSGSFGANITDNGIVAFDRSDTMTYGNVISGSGQVGQIGAGRTILTGANTYTGGTFISNGTLQVSVDANLGNAAGPLTFSGNGGTLNTTASFISARATTLNATGTFDVNPGTALTMTGVIGGAAALAKTDAGTLVTLPYAAH
jgi:autotransporter-associated beta strand protein